VNRLYCMLGMAMALPLLGGCFNNGSTASAPPTFNAAAGDGRVTLTWTVEPGVEYWLFTATDPALTAFNWTSLANAHAYTSAPMPFYACGLYDGTAYYFAANGRTGGGPGGASSPTVSAVPYNASSSSYWHGGSAIAGSNLYGVGYVNLSTCSNNAAISAAGNFAAVGAAGAIYASTDGISWAAPANLPSGFNTDLYAVTGNAGNLNDTTNPAIRWIAVGAGGASVYSQDGITWTVGTAVDANSAANPGNYALRSIAHGGGTFIAVGDSGTIISTSDGIAWNAQVSSTSSNLLGIAHGSLYVAVGENGTILTSATGAGWGQVTPAPTASTLRAVATNGNMIVAVGDNGTIVTSINGGHIWTAQPTLPGSPNLVSITAESQLPMYDSPIDPVLGAVPYAQFVAVDSNGNAYTSINGANWTGPFSIGTSSTNNLVSSGFGYVSVGNAGATAYAF
jgi:hypothetical protein